MFHGLWLVYAEDAILVRETDDGSMKLFFLEWKVSLNPCIVHFLHFFVDTFFMEFDRFLFVFCK